MLRLALVVLLLFVAGHARAEVDLDLSSGLVVIPVEMAGRHLRAILDTGAQVNALDISLAELGQAITKTGTLNFSDHVGGKAGFVRASLTVDGRSQKMEFALTKTRIADDCCDMILGKPFLENNTVWLDFAKMRLRLGQLKSPRGKIIRFALPPKAKEILLSCHVNGHSTLARLDLGSQQATDVTGDFVQELKLMDKPETMFLDSMLQPGVGLSAIDAHCGAWRLDPKVPALLQPPSQTAIGQGKVGLNIGLPWLKRFNILLDLPHGQVSFFARTPIPAVSYNALYVFFTFEKSRGVIVKSVLAGSAGEEIGVKPGDHVLKINGEDVKTVEEAYDAIERKPLGTVAVEIERNGTTLSLSGKITSLFPRKAVYPQSFYEFHRENSVAALAAGPLDLRKIKSLRLVFQSVDADFSLARKLGGIAVRDLLFRTLESKITRDGSSAYFEGLKLGPDRTFTADLSHSVPSLALDCASRELSVDTSWVSPMIVEFTEKMQGCGRHLQVQGAFYLSQDEPPGKNSEKNEGLAEPFYFLTDAQSGKTAHWNRPQLKLLLDRRAPDWVESGLREAIAQYNEVLKPVMVLNLQRANLKTVPLASPDTLGIYWSQEGQAFDRETRFAITRVVQNPKTGEISDADIILRAPEFLQHEKLVRSLANEAAARNPLARKKLDEFSAAQIQGLRRNVLIHELGHLLGLAHNFSEKEKSVMSYATIEKLSDYDRAALSYLYKKEKPQRTYDLQANPQISNNQFD